MQCPQLSFSLQRELSGSYQNLHRHQISSECSPDWGLQHPKVLSLEIPALPSLSSQCMFRKMVCFPRWCGKCAEVFWKEFKREYFCLGMQHSCKEAHFDDIHLLQIKIGWNRGLWSELVQHDKQADQNKCIGTDWATAVSGWSGRLLGYSHDVQERLCPAFVTGRCDRLSTRSAGGVPVEQRVPVLPSAGRDTPANRPGAYLPAPCTRCDNCCCPCALPNADSVCSVLL